MRKLMLTAVCLSLAMVASNSHAWWGYTKTKYPIVLVHGVTGFDTLGGLVNYFHKVPYNLERDGAKVYTVSVSFVNSSEARGEQLANFISGLGESKVNLMAHSQGAPTSRVAASIIPNKIASITSINGVNYGSKVADVIRNVIPPGSSVEGGANAIANAFGNIVGALSSSNNPQDGIAALETLTTSGTIALNNALGWKGVNPTYCQASSENVSINGNNIKMYSWSGKTPWTNVLDPADAFLLITSNAFDSGEDNDGLVASCATKMGKVISTRYQLNHVDAINHLFGVRSVWTNPISLYRSQANRLKNQGL
ncbi:esterase/lipase family protein [Alkalimarinus alittae]|uniref:Alpha/beta fold hydrolase n=1 Tax=Alkalimarinus alittae TaxID=2961619 RepID=A0ABY6N1P8_9ALTE|nr:alpha/beta fold hydrolase [Alkalimarinus alittae]UZE96041.1 alpha/beta fold hydrolase [Alkalimarinus alittae]